MSGKTWDEMTQPEKIEDLRRDILTLFNALNAANQRSDSLSAQTTTNFQRMAAMIDEINDRLKKASIS